MVEERRSSGFYNIDTAFRNDSRENRRILPVETRTHDRQQPVTREKPLVISLRMLNVLELLSQGVLLRYALDSATKNSEQRSKLIAEMGLLEKQLKKKRKPEDDYDGHALLIRGVIRSGDIPKIPAPIQLQDFQDDKKQKTVHILAKGYSKKRVLDELIKAQVTENQQAWARRRKEFAKILQAKSEDHLTALCVSLTAPIRPPK